MLTSSGKGRSCAEKARTAGDKRAQKRRAEEKMFQNNVTMYLKSMQFWHLSYWRVTVATRGVSVFVVEKMCICICVFVFVLCIWKDDDNCGHLSFWQVNVANQRCIFSMYLSFYYVFKFVSLFVLCICICVFVFEKMMTIVGTSHCGG